MTTKLNVEPVRVLCVDDNRDIADSTAELLGMLGYQTCACYSGAQALALAPTFRPQVILTDVNMPGLSGWELARRLRDRGSTAAVIAATAYGDPDAVARSSEAGCAGHLVKPVDPERLLQVLACCCSR